MKKTHTSTSVFLELGTGQLGPRVVSNQVEELQLLEVRVQVGMENVGFFFFYAVIACWDGLRSLAQGQVIQQGSGDYDHQLPS